MHIEKNFFQSGVEMGDRGKGQLANQETEEEEEIKRLLLGIMEGYNDNIIPPLSYFALVSNAENGSSTSRKRHKINDEASWAEKMSKERKRREQMNEHFSVLQSMVPSLCKNYKPPKEEIIANTVKYIEYLEEEKKRLEGLKKMQWKEPKVGRNVLMKCTNHKSSVKLTVSNNATFFSIQLPSRSGLLPEIVKVFEKNRAEVLEARVFVNEQKLLTFTATIVLARHGGSTINKIRQEILCL